MENKALVMAHAEEPVYRTKISTIDNVVFADESAMHGGGNSGMNPYELLAASLAACTSITLRMYAERKGYDLSELEVKIALQSEVIDNIAETVLYREIKFTGDFTDEQKERILHIANSCPIHKVLNGKIKTETKLV